MICEPLRAFWQPESPIAPSKNGSPEPQAVSAAAHLHCAALKPVRWTELKQLSSNSAKLQSAFDEHLTKGQNWQVHFVNFAAKYRRLDRIRNVELVAVYSYCQTGDVCVFQDFLFCSMTAVTQLGS